MRAYVGVTDGDWYRFLAARPGLREVNFWPSVDQAGPDASSWNGTATWCSRPPDQPFADLVVLGGPGGPGRAGQGGHQAGAVIGIG
jgi:hypothetical protein